MTGVGVRLATAPLLAAPLLAVLAGAAGGVALAVSVEPGTGVAVRTGSGALVTSGGGAGAWGLLVAAGAASGTG